MTPLTTNQKRTAVLYMIEHQLPANQRLETVHEKLSGTFSYQNLALKIALSDCAKVVRVEFRRFADAAKRSIND